RPRRRRRRGPRRRERRRPRAPHPRALRLRLRDRARAVSRGPPPDRGDGPVHGLPTSSSLILLDLGRAPGQSGGAPPEVRVRTRSVVLLVAALCHAGPAQAAPRALVILEQGSYWEQNCDKQSAI